MEQQSGGRDVFVGDDISQPLPSPANSEDLGVNNALSHVNTHDTGIGLDDFKLDDVFLEQFDPRVRSKLKLITAAHENAKKYLDITVKALSNQKQYLKYMSEQNRDYQLKLDSLESELRREQALKQKAESDIIMWKNECQKADVTFNKIKARKKHIQVSLAQMYEKYDVLVSENQSLRRLVENLSSNIEEKRTDCLPARKPKQATPRVILGESKTDGMVRLPPITKSSRARGPGKPKRSGQSSLPPIGQETSIHGDVGQQSAQSSYNPTKRLPTPWYKTKDANNSNDSLSKSIYRKL